MPNYQHFRDKILRNSGPFVSVNKYGKLTFNAEGTAILKNQNARAASILWDPEMRALAFRFVDPNHQHAYKFTYHTESQQAALIARRFFRQIGWNTKERVKIPFVWNEADQLLEMMLPAESINHSSMPSTFAEKPAVAA